MAEERSMERLIETLKEPVQLSPDFDARVLAAVERVAEDTRRTRSVTSIAGWLRGRTIRLSPLGASGLAAAIVAAVLIGSSMIDRDAAPAPPQPAVAGDQVQMTQFVLVAPEARSVAVVGDFNDWNLSATPLVREAGDGMWWITLPLSPGRYRYAFVVDGTTWQSDPDAPAAEDEFGRPSSVVSIGGA